MGNKLLIYIVAHNAQDQLPALLDRIPQDVISKYDSEVLIIDDSSVDDTFKIAHQEETSNNKFSISVLHNPIKQGYGGNLKLSFEYAIKNNFDALILLHSNGIYAPEVMMDMVSPVFEDNAAMVIGSRVKSKGRKRKIPTYKWLGNKILTSYQNRIHKTELTDFHSGYRAYSVEALKSIPFGTNNDGFVFDTQIIIQQIISGNPIVEVAIPIYSSQEMYLFNGFVYGLSGIKETLASKLHKLSIFYRREYDLTSPFEDYSLKLGYLSSHSLAIDNTEAGCHVLDIGGGQGRIALELKKKGCKLTGIDMCTLKDKTIYEEFYQRNLDNFTIDFDITKFDTLLLLDIIEHLSNPEEFLDMFRLEFGLSQPKIIMTTPNIAFIITRLQLMLGRFNYGKEGILDKTHKRLFTFKTLKKACQQCGYTIEKVKGIPAPFPKALGKNFLGMTLLNINRFFIFLSKAMFSYQIYVEIKPTPVVSALLKNTLVESIKKKSEIEATI